MSGEDGGNDGLPCLAVTAKSDFGEVFDDADEFGVFHKALGVSAILLMAC